MRRALLATLALPLASACRGISLEEYAAMGREADVRCLVLEDDLTLFSPFDPTSTGRLLKDVRDSLHAIEAALEVDIPPSLVVRFEIVQMASIELRDDGDGTLSITGLEPPKKGVYRAFARSSKTAPLVLIYVSPNGKLIRQDGSEAKISLDFRTVPVIRHELAHIGALFADLDGPTWFSEGIAEEFESRRMDEHGALVPVPVPDSLRIARQEHAAFSIDELLDWDESFHRVSVGEEAPFLFGRALGHSLLRYLLEFAPGDSLVAQLKSIQAMGRAELRSHELRWKAWLDAVPRE